MINKGGTWGTPTSEAQPTRLANTKDKWFANRFSPAPGYGTRGRPSRQDGRTSTAGLDPWKRELSCMTWQHGIYRSSRPGVSPDGVPVQPGRPGRWASDLALPPTPTHTPMSIRLARSGTQQPRSPSPHRPLILSMPPFFFLVLLLIPPGPHRLNGQKQRCRCLTPAGGLATMQDC